MAKKKFNPNAIKSQADAKQLLSMLIVPDNMEEVYVTHDGKVYFNKDIAELRRGEGKIFTVKTS